jgi:hypothetical protein
VLILAIAANCVSAQDFKKVKIAVGILKWEDAKTEVDKLANDPKSQSNPEFFYYQARVYAAIFKDATLRAKYPQAVDVASTALDKYAALDASFSKFKAIGPDPIADLYSSYLQLGNKYFFDDKLNEEAGENYFRSSKYFDILVKNKLIMDTSTTIDTTTMFYAGVAFQNANKMEKAALCFERLAEKKVNDDKFINMYSFLLQHYIKLNNESSFIKYFNFAKELYPDQNWDELESLFMDTNYDLAKKTSLYDTQDAAGKLTESKYIQFGDLFNNVRNKEKELDSLTQVKYTLKAAEAFKKAYQLNNKNAVAIYNVGAIYLNIFNGYNELISTNIRSLRAISTANEDEFAAKKSAAKTPQAKAAVNKAATEKLAAAQAPIKAANASLEIELQKNMDISIESLEITFNLLKDQSGLSKRDNNILKNSVSYLGALYEFKRDKYRSKDLKQFDIYEAKVKEFDALYEKYKN